LPKQEYNPAWIKDKRRKVDDPDMRILLAQLLVEDVTIRQGAKENIIRTKYINKLHRVQDLLRKDEVLTEEEIITMMQNCVQCPICLHHYFGNEALIEHQKKWGPNCVKFKGKRLTTD
jgi:hypothetical protein